MHSSRDQNIMLLYYVSCTWPSVDPIAKVSSMGLREMHRNGDDETIDDW